MPIDIPKEVEAIAQQNSSAMGVSVADYVSHLILGDNPELLSERDLIASAASLDRAMEDVQAGRTLSVSEAKLRVEPEWALFGNLRETQRFLPPFLFFSNGVAPIA